MTTRWITLTGRRIEQYTSPNRGGQMTGRPMGIVCHTAVGSYRGTIGWQLNPDQEYEDGTKVNTSSTWIVGKHPGEWAQMVPLDEIAWCQRAGSRTWHSIEFAGRPSEPLTDWQIEAAAQLLAQHHRTYGTPLVVSTHPGVRGLGHHSMDREHIGEEWGHDQCPGPLIVKQKPVIVARARAIINPPVLPKPTPQPTPDSAPKPARPRQHVPTIHRFTMGD